MVPATGLGLFRIAFGLVIIQEIIFLFYFRHLIFDLTPFLDRTSTLIHVLLLLWGVIAVFLTIGYHTRINALLNYIFWVVFVVFTNMWEDFDGGFDQLVIGSSFLLIFIPSERAFSLDNLRLRLAHFKPNQNWQPPRVVPILSYLIVVLFSLELLYFDSFIHKLFAEHWLNGMGAWLPASMPYYISALDVSWLLNQKQFMQFVGYLILVFQACFVFIFFWRRTRVPILLIGSSFHLGITLLLNIYPFGLVMLVHYLLVVPFSWWRWFGNKIRANKPTLTVFYDEDCPLCCRTVATIQHFDIAESIDFKGLQSFASDQPQLANIDQTKLLKDLYAVDQNNRLYSGVDTYLQILKAMGYLAPFAYLLSLPGIYHCAQTIYRRIADKRTRNPCNETCLPVTSEVETDFISKYLQSIASTPNKAAKRIAKIAVLILLLQLNISIVHGLIHRIPNDLGNTVPGKLLLPVSGVIALFSHGLLGITPHALYLHDHFEGFNHILAFTYIDEKGQEQWLPFVNQQGRMLAPNWGRVHSMWANIGFTARIVPWRMNKAIKRITAYWCTEAGLGLENCQLTVKMKKIDSPTNWVMDLRKHNLNGLWQNIGTVIWKDNQINITLPNIEKL
ncbi:MAG: DCC1-like thiol-disulfide oxidoreductase family protein [Methylococcales bacterium]